MAFDTTEPQRGFEDTEAPEPATGEAEVIEMRVPPHDLQAEAAVISAVLVDTNAVDQVIDVLRHEHFYSEAHGRIFEAVEQLHGAGKPIDVVTVATWLRDHQRIAQVGGMAYLTEILNAAPAVANVAAYGQTVAAKWRARQAILIGQRTAALGYGGCDSDQLVAAGLADLQALRAPITTADAMPLVERARAMRARGPVTRIPTGLATLDDNCGGGLRLGTVVMVGGPPGVGKTAVTVDFAHRSARAGIPVAFVAGDEGPDDIVMRVALHEGLDPAKLERNDPDEWDALERRLGALPLYIFDADDGATLESAAAQLVKVAAGAPAILCGDSVQTLSAAGTAEAESPRARVDAVVRSAKAIARSGLLVLLTSELARGAYRNRAAADNVDPLAAFKESGGIEYGAQTALVLRSLPDGDGVVEVAVPKNRGGRKRPFYLEIDQRTRVREVADPSGDPAQAQQRESEQRAKNRREVGRDAEVLAATVRMSPDLGERALRAALRASGHKWGVERLDAARQVLVDGFNGHRLVNRSTHPRACLWRLEPVAGMAEGGRHA